jgi:integrase
MIDHGPLSTHQARKIVRKRAAEAGYPTVAPHDLRRFLISTLVERVDLALAARVVGHKNPATTAGYDRRPLARQRDAVASLTFPPAASLLGHMPDLCAPAVT